MSSPVIPWMGGKRRLADRLIPLFPPHECYVEVFAGSAALFFLRPQPAPIEVGTQLQADLRVAKNDPAGNAYVLPCAFSLLKCV